MALPIRPAQGLPTARPRPLPQDVLPALPNLPEENSLPEVPAPEAGVPAPRKEPVSAPTPSEATPEPRRNNSSEGEDWVVDPKTGKRYKRIAGYRAGVMKSRAAVASVSKRGASLEELRLMVEEEPDFNLDDLNGSAETFLSHLRVPPDKEEQRKLLEERARRQKQFDDMASRAAAEESSDS